MNRGYFLDCDNQSTENTISINLNFEPSMICINYNLCDNTPDSSFDESMNQMRTYKLKGSAIKSKNNMFDGVGRFKGYDDTRGWGIKITSFTKNQIKYLGYCGTNASGYQYGLYVYNILAIE